MSFLLTTKLIPPKVSQTFISRPRLNEKLDSGVEGKVTLIAAPAGYGKTTLVAAWLKEQKETDAAWLSLDEFDDDPLQFLRYFVAAWQKIDENIGQVTQELLDGNTTGLLQSSPHTLLIPLINDLASAENPCLLVLDDWHVIENPATQQLLTFWVENAPPHSHIIITTRHVPELHLSRWRVRGQVVEVNHQDLQFTVEEAKRFLQQSVKIEISESDIEKLMSRTEGWAASLQLVALSLQGHDPTQKLPANLLESHRYVVDYLIDEVLSRESAEIKAFLFDTSILTRLTGPLCDAITGRSDSQDRLLTLDQRNLFINSVDDSLIHFRYHPLFADTLQKQLRSKNRSHLQKLNERAYRFFMSENTWNEGIKHGLAAGLYDEVAEFLNTHADKAIWQQNQASQVTGWCQQLPLEVLSLYPRLMLDYGWAMLWNGKRKTLKKYIQSIAPLFEQVEPNELKIEFTALQIEMEILRNDLDDSLEQLNSIDFGSLKGISSYSLIRQVQGYTNRIDGNVLIAEEALKDAKDVCARTKNIILWFGSAADLADLYRIAGRLRDSSAIFNEIINRVPKTHHIVYGGIQFAMINHAWVLLRRNQLAAALESVQQALAYARSNGRNNIFERLGLLVMAYTRQAQGEAEQASQLMDRAVEYAEKGKNKRHIAELHAHRANLHLIQGNISAATSWANSFAVVRPDYMPRVMHHLLMTIYGRWLLTQDIPAAIAHLKRCEEEAENNFWGDCLLEILILLAIAFQQNGQLQSALSHLEKAVNLAEQEGYIEPFVTAGQPMVILLRQLLQQGGSKEQIGRIQAAFLPATTTQQDLIDPLTNRELEILRLMAEGFSNPEIAEHLIIATGTVARHTNNIFGKLAVRNRTEATIQAKSLNLI